MTRDPFTVLGLTPAADDAAIRAAYHDHVRRGSADAQVNAAYTAIRDASARARRRWSEPTAMIAPLPAPAAPAFPVDALVAELAFLSDWELGEPHGR